MAFQRPNCLHSDAVEPLLSNLATWSGKMKSTDEASIQGHNLCSDREKHSGVCNAGPVPPWGLGFSLESWPPQNTEGKGELPIPQGQEFLLEAQQDEIQSGGSVCWDCEGRPGSPADKKGDTLDFMPHLTADSEDIMKQLTIQEVRGTSRYQSQESWITELSAIWANAEAGSSRRDALTLTSSETMQGSAAPLHQPSGPEVGLAWGKPKRDTSWEAQRPSSDPESSHEFSEIQLMRGDIHPKEGGQARSSSPREPEDPARSTSVHSRDNFLHTLGPLPTSAPQGLTSALEKQASTELEAGCSKKMQSMLWGKGGNMPSYPGAASAAAAGGLPRAIPRIKTIREMNSFGSSSKVTMDRTFPSWGQRLREHPLEPVTFPPISGVPLLGRSKKYSLLPWEPQQPKHNASVPNVPQTAWESQPVANEDNNPNKDAVLQAELPIHRPGIPCQCMNCGEFRSCDPNIRVPQPPGFFQSFDLFHGGLMSRGPVPSDKQNPPVPCWVPERPQQPSGKQDCPRCVALQNEIQVLKQQIAIMHSLYSKFQDNWSEC